MEARRAFVGSRSYRQLWIMLAALVCAAILAAGAAFIANGVASSGASKAPGVTYPAPGTVVNQDKGTEPSVSQPKHQQTVF